MSFAKMLFSGLLYLASFSAVAQWPEKPIKIIMPYGAGGSGDILARTLANELSQTLRQPVIVENKIGATGNIGVKTVAQAAPDGYTLLIAPANNFVINKFLFQDLGLDPLKALAPVSLLVDVPSVIFTSASLPPKTYTEFVAYSRAHPNKMNYGSPGVGTTLQLLSEQINQLSKLGMTHIPFNGAPAIITSMISGDVQMMVMGVNVGLPFINSGKLRALAIANPSRLPLLPDTPTFQEVGLGSLKVSSWWAMAAPRGTPPNVMNRLNLAVQAALEKPQVRKQLSTQGQIIVGGGPKTMAQRLTDEAAHWKRELVALGATSK